MIIKEVYRQPGSDPRIILREDNYDSHLSKFDYLFDKAVQDFPALERDRVTIAHYGGSRIKRQWGIEFVFYGDEADIPEYYVKIAELELTL